MSADRHRFVVVANRLPVDRQEDADGAGQWKPSPGGLVAALRPIMAQTDGAWVGWAGVADASFEPFETGDMHLVPVPLSEQEVGTYYEGFANGTLWPLYHDVIVPPEYHRAWWDSYVEVNRRFADAAAAQAESGGFVWVHDYQLQLVPRMVREQRDDVKIAFFNHIPFPAPELFAQLPWRESILRGLLGADLVGFQRPADAENFVAACRRILRATTKGTDVVVHPDEPHRRVRAAAFPISIDAAEREETARSQDVTAEVTRIRAQMGGRKILLGVDRLDYIKGITHRLKAYGELLTDGSINPRDAVLVQVATPSRERVAQYAALRDDIELTVGRLNGDYSTLGRPAVHYLHTSFGPTEMAALYRAADVLLVTSLRDGMNLVAKEYVASRFDNRGVLVLSEFAGVADEFRQAVRINPHDISGTKDAIVRALAMSEAEQRKAMRAMRRRVAEYGVSDWAESILQAVDPDLAAAAAPEHDGADTDAQPLSRAIEATLELAGQADVLIALDFDGTLSHIVNDRDAARMTPENAAAIKRLADIEGVHLALVSGRSLNSLNACAQPPAGAHLVAGHGAEIDGEPIELTDEQLRAYATVQHAFEDLASEYDGLSVECKPTAVVLHTRGACDTDAEKATAEALRTADDVSDVNVIEGKRVIEVSVADTNKGLALLELRDQLAARSVVYVGDDTTDEDAFAHLAKEPSSHTDITVKVGEGSSRATHRVADPDEVARFLDGLADTLGGSTDS